MCLNFTANCFVFRRKNCKNAPRILYKLCKQGISKMCLNFPCCDLRVALIVKIWPVHFGKIMKLCLVKFSPLKEISSKFASADFKNFCWLVSKKVPFFSA